MTLPIQNITPSGTITNIEGALNVAGTCACSGLLTVANNSVFGSNAVTIYYATGNVDITGTISSATWGGNVIAHEYGGLEADVSAYSGLLKISGGSTSAVTITSAGEAILDDADASSQRATLGLVIGTDVLAPNGNGSSLTGMTATQVGLGNVANVNTTGVGLTVTLGNGTDAITTSEPEITIKVPFSGTITANTLLADQSGSIVLDIEKVAYADYDGSFASIVASAPPTLSSAIKSQDSTLTGWTTSVSAGDILRISVTSATTVTRVALALDITRT